MSSPGRAVSDYADAERVLESPRRGGSPIPNRWLILLVLFLARLSMAFQFQSVAALSPVLVDHPAIGLADIGVLIGLYLGPGVIMAIPGGALAARFGDRRIVFFSFALMLAGGLLIVLSTGLAGMLAGRLIAGVGGVFINVVMTKMVVDWFADREIATAMSLFISSWPIGIALALLILPRAVTMGGTGLAWIVCLLVIALALLLFAIVYRAPPAAAAAFIDVPKGNAPFPVVALCLSGAIWGVFNAALAMVFGFGSLALVGNGVSLLAAGSIVSLFTISIGLGNPVGGVLSDRSGWRDAIIFLGLVAGVLLLPVLPIVPLGLAVVLFGAAGFILGLVAGPIMTLPAQVLAPEHRAVGMGGYFAIYYGVMMISPSIAGGLAENGFGPSVAFLCGSVMLAGCVILFWMFLRQVR